MKPKYSEYMQSAGWRAVREGKLFSANYKCEKCGFEDPHLEVHHLNYDRLGDERNSDLIVLCHYCHTKEHNGARQ